MTTNRLSNSKREMFFSELESYLSAGLDFNNAFTMLIDSERDKKMCAILTTLYESVVRGDTLADAMIDCGYFSPLDCGVIRIGEQTGQLAASLLFLSEYYNSVIARKRILVNALSYPLIIITAAVIVMVFMLAVIVPMFEQVYSRMGGEMPAITKMVIALSENFKWWLLTIFLIVAPVVVWFKVREKDDSVRKIKDNTLLRLPVIGKMVRKSIEVRFCVLLHLLYSSGVPLLKAIEMLRDIITLYPYQKSFDDIALGLTRGETIKSVMERYDKIYNRKLIVLLGVGEETNKLDIMLKKQGEDIGKELEYELKQLGSMLEPILIIVVGAIVAFILIAMYMPMFNLGNVIQS